MTDDLFGIQTASQCQRYQSSQSFGIGHGGVAALTDAGEDLEGLLVEVGDGNIEIAKTGIDLIGDRGQGIGPFFGKACLGGQGLGENLLGAAAVAVDGDALGVEIIGQPIGLLDIGDTGLVGEIDGFGDGIIHVFLEGSLGADMPFRRDLMSGDEIIG